MRDKSIFKSSKKSLQVGIRPASGETYTALTEDLATAGFFIKTQKVFPHGTLLEISFKGSTEPIVTVCRVVWARKSPSALFPLTNKNGMGVLITEFKKGEDAYRQLYRTAQKANVPCRDVHTGQNSPLYITGAA